MYLVTGLYSGCLLTWDNRLAPEFPFPIGVNDCWDALKWALANSSTLKVTPERGLVVGGASAGGNISAVLALLARDENLQPPITGQYLCVPALLPHEKVPSRFTHLYQSRLEMSVDPVLSGKMDMSPVMQMYNPTADSPLWDPFNHPEGHKGAAKAFFQVGGLDPLRDEAVLYDRVLREAGVLTRFELYAGFGHMFWTNWPEMEKSKSFVQDTVVGMKWLLERWEDVSSQEIKQVQETDELTQSIQQVPVEFFQHSSIVELDYS
jgi:acetyl esterase/lipase